MNSYERNLAKYERYLRLRDRALLSVFVALATAAVIMMVFSGCATISKGSIDWDRALEVADRIDSALAERRAAVEASDAFERAAKKDRSVFMFAVATAVVVYSETEILEEALESADRMAFAGRGVDFYTLAERVWNNDGLASPTPPGVVDIMGLFAPIFEERIGALEAEEVGP